MMLDTLSTILTPLLIISFAYTVGYIRKLAKWTDSVDRRLCNVEIASRATIEVLGKGDPSVYQRLTELHDEAKKLRNPGYKCSQLERFIIEIKKNE